MSEHELDCVGRDQHQAGQHLVKEVGQHSVRESEQAEYAESVTETDLDCLELEEPEVDYLERDQQQAGQHSMNESKVNEESVIEVQEQQRQYEEDKMRGNESPEILEVQQRQLETAELQKGKMMLNYYFVRNSLVALLEALCAQQRVSRTHPRDAAETGRTASAIRRAAHPVRDGRTGNQTANRKGESYLRSNCEHRNTAKRDRVAAQQGL